MTTQTETSATPYALLGGAAGVTAIVERFYALMDGTPEFAPLRRLHAPDLSATRTLLFEFLSGWLGGPPLYFQRAEHRCIMSAHRRFAIGPQEAAQWLTCMRQTLTQCGVDEVLQQQIMAALTRMASGMRNREA